MKRILSLLLIPIALLSYEKGLDVSLSLDPFNVEKGSRVDINHQMFFPLLNSTFVVNPRLCAYFDNHVDLSLGVGHRLPLKGNLFGYHVFYDFSKHSPMYFHQGGISLEYITSSFDYRVNYYHPLGDSSVLQSVAYEPHKWMESEVIWKGDRFNVGVGPVYNVSTNSFSAKFRVAIPYQNLVLSAGVECDETFDLRSFVSVGYKLYNMGKSAENPTVARTNRVRFNSRELPYVLPSLPDEHKEKKHEGALYIALDRNTVLSSELSVYVKDYHNPMLIHTQKELETLLDIYGEDAIFAPVDQININYVTAQEEIPSKWTETPNEYPDQVISSPSEPESRSWWERVFSRSSD